MGTLIDRLRPTLLCLALLAVSPAMAAPASEKVEYRVARGPLVQALREWSRQGDTPLLFDAREKFESGTGWPSFTQPVAADVIAYRSDDSHGMLRIETVCNICDAHLGHVFPDGPPPSGLRYCMNGVALRKDGSAHSPG